MAGAAFVFGLGYSTAGVARQAIDVAGWQVTSTARQPDRFAPLACRQHRVLQFDPAAGRPLSDEGCAALAGSSYVITSVPPLAAKLYDPVLQAQHRLLREVAASGAHQMHGLCYLSSTGVYGDWQGAWVDESCEPRTATARGLLRLEAELAWTALAQQLGIPLTILRLGGIYGPRRSVLHNLQAGAPPRSSATRRQQQRFTSRCHVADVAQAVLADMKQRRAGAQQMQGHQEQQGQQGQQQQQQQGQQQQQLLLPLVDIVNVVDDEPAPRGDVEAYALQLLGGAPAAAAGGAGTAAVPPGPSGAGERERGAAASGAGSQQEQQLPRRRRSEALEEKRVANRKLKQQLGVVLAAPTYREGLAALHAGDVSPFAAVDLACMYGW